MFDNYKEIMKEYGGGRIYLSADDYPIKCAWVGKEETGCAQWGRSGPKAVSKDEGGSFKFAVNVWDGHSCRILEGSKSLYQKLFKVHKETAGLDNIWVEIGKSGSSQMSPYYAKYAGDLTDADKKKRDGAEKHDLFERCKWLKQPERF